MSVGEVKRLKGRMELGKTQLSRLRAWGWRIKRKGMFPIKRKGMFVWKTILSGNILAVCVCVCVHVHMYVCVGGRGVVGGELMSEVQPVPQQNKVAPRVNQSHKWEARPPFALCTK